MLFIFPTHKREGCLYLRSVVLALVRLNITTNSSDRRFHVFLRPFVCVRARYYSGSRVSLFALAMTNAGALMAGLYIMHEGFDT